MRSRAKMIATAAFAGFVLLGILLSAEMATAQAAAMPYSGGQNIDTPKIDLFVGYSYVQAVPKMAEGNRLVWLNGGSTSLAYNLNRHLGIVADLGDYTNSQVRFQGASGATVDVDNAGGAVISYLFGPRYSFRNHERITPFAQVLFGGAHANEVLLSNCAVNCALLPAQNTFALTAGGGLDLRVHRHFAIRVIQAEYLLTRFPDTTTGNNTSQNDMRLSSGIVFRLGGNTVALPPSGPVTLSCSVTPRAVFPGEPISASATALNLDPAKTEVYSWSVNGGTVTGSASTAKIDTTNLAPGAYTLGCHVAEGSNAGEFADATAPYTVKKFEAPTVSCSANPHDLISGENSAITAIGLSPQNRPLTYSYRSTSGSVSGTGSTATLATTGATIGPITVTCSVSDDQGQTASETTLVTIAIPVAAPKPVTSELCSIHFDREINRPSRVNNEGKACLDEIALELQRSPDAKLALIGKVAGAEKNGKKLAMARAVNAKAYLVGEKGIDAARISTYTGSQDEKAVDTILIPSGATFNDTGDAAVE